MKRVGYLYEKVIDINNCRRAILDASKGKRRRKLVRKILADIYFYAEDLSSRLQNLDFTTPYRTKHIKDGLSGKERDILVPAWYPDQCAHHAIVRILAPIISKSSYCWSCANMPGKGIDKASKCIERGTKRDKKNSKYCAKADVKKFYPSVDHGVLRAMLAHKIKDKRFLELLDVIIDSCEDGLPIGNYTSPWLAELYLQGLDVFILNHEATKRYCRYADDIVILGTNKKKLHKLVDGIKEYLATIRLRLKENWQVFKVQNHYIGRRIDFIGKCFGIGFTTIRKRRSLAFIRQSRRIKSLQERGLPIPFKMAAGFISRSACLKRTNSQALRVKYFDTIDTNQLKEVIRKHGMAYNNGFTA